MMLCVNMIVNDVGLTEKFEGKNIVPLHVFVVNLAVGLEYQCKDLGFLEN